MEGTKRNYINSNKICLISRFRGYFHMNESNHRLCRIITEVRTVKFKFLKKWTCGICCFDAMIDETKSMKLNRYFSPQFKELTIAWRLRPQTNVFVRKQRDTFWYLCFGWLLVNWSLFFYKLFNDLTRLQIKRARISESQLYSFLNCHAGSLHIRFNSIFCTRIYSLGTTVYYHLYFTFLSISNF